MSDLIRLMFPPGHERHEPKMPSMPYFGWQTLQGSFQILSQHHFEHRGRQWLAQYLRGLSEHNRVIGRGWWISPETWNMMIFERNKIVRMFWDRDVPGWSDLDEVCVGMDERVVMFSGPVP